MATKNASVFTKILANIIKHVLLRRTSTIVISILAITSTLIGTWYTMSVFKAMSKLSEDFHSTFFEETLWKVLIYSLIATAFKSGPRIVFTYVQQMILRRQFVRFLQEYMAKDYVNFRKKTPGELRYLIFLKAFAVSLATNIVLFDFFTLLGTVLFSFHDVARKGNVLVSIIFIIVPIVYIMAVLYYIGKRNEYLDDYLHQQEFVSTKLYDKLLNYEIIKSSNLEENSRDEFRRELNPQFKAQVKMSRFEPLGEYILNLLLLLPYIVLVLIYFLKNAKEGSTDSMLKTSILYFVLYSQLKSLGTQLINLVYYLYQIDFAEQPINGEHEGTDSIIEFSREIELRDLTLYHDSKAVVSNINATIRRGEKIAIVGKNGTGKSTFVKALLGFTRFTGEILIDGRSTRDLSWRSIRRLISYVSQDDYTSDDTVLNNLRLGGPGATREEIEERARAYGAHSTFMQLERGYETEAGPRGNRLSGGQRQKISLVRAAVRDAPIFVMDEATSSMDKQYEKQLIERLFRNLGGKTLVMIVHGDEYLERFDRVFFLNGGRLEEAGSFAELMERCASFRAMIEDK